MGYKMQTLKGQFGGLKQKIDFIRRGYPGSLTDPEVRRFAELGAGRGTRFEQVRNLYAHIKAHVAYLPDPLGVEMTKTPSVMLREIAERGGQTAGDCDDQASLSYTLLKSIGIPAKLRVVWFDGCPMPGHIFPMARVDGDWITFDTTNKAGMGVAPRGVTKQEDFL
jgi:transglutaminase-like putative cysteine protease